MRMIMLPRRRLLAMHATLLAPLTLERPVEHVARLRPDKAGPVFLDRIGSKEAVFHAEGVPGAITLPSPARLAGMLPIAEREIACIAFPADAVGGALELMALAGWNGATLRLLGLEVRSWAGADGATLASWFGGVGDRSRLRIGREAARPQPGRPRAWENWTDFLAWREIGPLAAAPMRPPLPGTWQAGLAGLRTLVEARLAAPCHEVPAELVRAAAAAVSPGAPASPPSPGRSTPPAEYRR